jgi:glycosyltransferase involved in cell wall biosynthesis
LSDIVLHTASCALTAIVPACRRLEPLLTTLRRIQDCNPVPDEIIVHVDGGNEEIVAAVRGFNPAIRILTSSTLLGPGGSRNRLIAAAKHELVANFDDDSFPSHANYFARVLRLAERFPDAAIFSAASHAQEWRSLQLQQIALPSGCGSVFRKGWFQRTTGFVALPVAYNMEEVDIGLQLHAIGGMIVHDPLLRVVHDHAPVLEVDARTNAIVLANTALFPFLRFPIWLWPLGFWSVFRRVLLLVRWRWTAGLSEGLRMIPEHLIRHRMCRKVVSSSAVLNWMLLKRHPKDLGDAKLITT